MVKNYFFQNWIQNNRQSLVSTTNPVTTAVINTEIITTDIQTVVVEQFRKKRKVSQSNFAATFAQRLRNEDETVNGVTNVSGVTGNARYMGRAYEKLRTDPVLSAEAEVWANNRVEGVTVPLASSRRNLVQYYKGQLKNILEKLLQKIS